MDNRGNSNPDTYLTSEYYSLLNPEEKELWRKLTHNMKIKKDISKHFNGEANLWTNQQVLGIR